MVQRADGGLDGARERGGVGRVVQVRDAVAEAADEARVQEDDLAQPLQLRARLRGARDVLARGGAAGEQQERRGRGAVRRDEPRGGGDAGGADGAVPAARAQPNLVRERVARLLMPELGGGLVRVRAWVRLRA